MKFQEMSVLLAPKPGISGIFGQMESAHYHHPTSGLIQILQFDWLR